MTDRPYRDEELEALIRRELARSRPPLDLVRRKPYCLVERHVQFGNWKLLAPLCAALPDGTVKHLTGRIKVPYLARFVPGEHQRSQAAEPAGKPEYRVVKVLAPDTEPPRHDEESNIKNRAAIKWILHWYGSLEDFVREQTDLFSEKVSHGNIQPVTYILDRTTGLYYCDEPVAYADLRHWAANQFFSVDREEHRIRINTIDPHNPAEVEEARARGVMVPATLPDAVRYGFATALIEALAVCHQGDNPEIHGDIKPDNIVIERRKGRLDIKLADFDVFTDKDIITEAGTTDDIMIAGQRAASLETMTVSTGATHSRPKTTRDDVFAMAKTLFYLFTARGLEEYEGRNLTEDSLGRMRQVISTGLHGATIHEPFLSSIERAINGDINNGVEWQEYMTAATIPAQTRNTTSAKPEVKEPERAYIHGAHLPASIKVGSDYDADEPLDANDPDGTGKQSSAGQGLTFAGIAALIFMASSMSTHWGSYFRSEPDPTIRIEREHASPTTINPGSPPSRMPRYNPTLNRYDEQELPRFHETGPITPSLPSSPPVTTPIPARRPASFEEDQYIPFDGDTYSPRPEDSGKTPSPRRNQRLPGKDRPEWEI